MTVVDLRITRPPAGLWAPLTRTRYSDKPTARIMVRHHYRNGVHALVLDAYDHGGWTTEKTRTRIASNPVDHESILRMYERQTGSVVLRHTKQQTTTTPPYGDWRYEVVST